jgi:hypothetical protein
MSPLNSFQPLAHLLKTMCFNLQFDDFSQALVMRVNPLQGAACQGRMIPAPLHQRMMITLTHCPLKIFRRIRVAKVVGGRGQAHGPALQKTRHAEN